MKMRFGMLLLLPAWMAAVGAEPASPRWTAPAGR